MNGPGQTDKEAQLGLSAVFSQGIIPAASSGLGAALSNNLFLRNNTHNPNELSLPSGCLASKIKPILLKASQFKTSSGVKKDHYLLCPTSAIEHMQLELVVEDEEEE